MTVYRVFSQGPRGNVGLPFCEATALIWLAGYPLRNNCGTTFGADALPAESRAKRRNELEKNSI
jgi:hypothetical protein